MLQITLKSKSFFEYSVRRTNMETATRYLRIFSGYIGARYNELYGDNDIFLYNAQGEVLRRIED